jgi:hypothetical protein
MKGRHGKPLCNRLLEKFFKIKRSADHKGLPFSGLKIHDFGVSISIAIVYRVVSSERGAPLRTSASACIFSLTTANHLNIVASGKPIQFGPFRT